MKRTIFFISDGTGITVETIGHSLLTQFDSIEFEKIVIPYVNSLERAREVVAEVNEIAKKSEFKPLIFTTLVDPEMLKVMRSAKAKLIDVFAPFVSVLEQEFKSKARHEAGHSHGLNDYSEYMSRLDAVDYALANDDGSRVDNYGMADLILIGVSRCGKTPTSLYLALQHSLFTANYPLTEDDLDNWQLPNCLKPYQDKLFGLTIDAHRLCQIRQERRPNSRYAELSQCEREVATIEKLFKRLAIPFLNTTTRSIEEIATEIMAATGRKRRNS